MDVCAVVEAGEVERHGRGAAECDAESFREGEAGGESCEGGVGVADGVEEDEDVGGWMGGGGGDD